MRQEWVGQNFSIESTNLLKRIIHSRSSSGLKFRFIKIILLNLRADNDVDVEYITFWLNLTMKYRFKGKSNFHDLKTFCSEAKREWGG